MPPDGIKPHLRTNHINDDSVLFEGASESACSAGALTLKQLNGIQPSLDLFFTCALRSRKCVFEKFEFSYRMNETREFIF